MAAQGTGVKPVTHTRNCTTCRFCDPATHPIRPETLECRGCGGAFEGWKNYQPRVISADPPCATCRHVQVFLAPIAPNATKPEPCGSCRQPLETHAAHEWRNHQLGDVAFNAPSVLSMPYLGTDPAADPAPEGQDEAARRLAEFQARRCDHGLLEATSDGRRCKDCGASWSYSVAHDAERMNTTETPAVPRVIEPPVFTLVDPAAINELEWLCSPVGEFVDDAQRLAALISAGQRSVTEHRRRVNELLEANNAEVDRRREAEHELERRNVSFEAMVDVQIETSRALAPLMQLEKLVVSFLSSDALMSMASTAEEQAAAQAHLDEKKAALHEFYGTRPRESRGHA